MVVLVVDNGAGSAKAGFASEDTPRYALDVVKPSNC